MDNCTIAIIIPAFNVEKYLKAALESIRVQTELPDEVILIDDGSTDGTLHVAKAFQFPVPYRVVSIENGGQGNARNLGVSLASSEYVYFFDSDDRLTNNFIRSIKTYLRHKQRPDIVLFSGESFNDGEYRGSRWVDYRRGFSGTFANRGDFLDEAFSHRALFCSPCLYVSRKSLWGPDRLQFGPNFLEDEAVFFPLLFACRTFGVMNEVFFLRRNREGSTMTMTPGVKHVYGAMNCVETTLTLSRSAGLNSRERLHIRKRLESLCVAYIVMARRAGVPLQVGTIATAIVHSRSVRLFMKAMIYSIRADRFAAVRLIGRAAKRVESFARR